MCISLLHEFTIPRRHKKFCDFSGLRPMRPCVSVNISRADSRILSATPIRACLMAGRKATNNKKPLLAVKKVRLTPVQKMITIFFIGRSQTDGITQAAVFLPPTAAFFYGQRPLFEPCRLLSSCKAWRWGWWRRQGGKRDSRLVSPTATKRRSRQQPPWLFVFISTTNRSNQLWIDSAIDFPQSAATPSELLKMRTYSKL